MQALVVSGHAGMRELLAKTLTLDGYEVQTASSGREALDLVTEHTLDAIVLEPELPDIDGVEVCRQLRDGGVRIPIIMVSAQNTVDDRVTGLNAGADEYLGCPFSVPELTARLRALLRRSKAQATRSPAPPSTGLDLPPAGPASSSEAS